MKIKHRFFFKSFLSVLGLYINQRNFLSSSGSLSMYLVFKVETYTVDSSEEDWPNKLLDDNRLLVLFSRFFFSKMAFLALRERLLDDDDQFLERCFGVLFRQFFFSGVFIVILGIELTSLTLEYSFSLFSLSPFMLKKLVPKVWLLPTNYVSEYILRHILWGKKIKKTCT